MWFFSDKSPWNLDKFQISSFEKSAGSAIKASLFQPFENLFSDLTSNYPSLFVLEKKENSKGKWQ